jgi:hypothetical protein
MTKGLGLPLVAGLASGLVFLLVAIGSVVGALLFYLTPLPLVFVGLSIGLTQAVVASAVALVVVGVAAPGALPAFGVVAVLPTLLLVWLALRWRQRADGTVEWYPPGRLLAWLTVAAVGLLLVGAEFARSGGTGFEAAIKQFVEGFVGDMGLDLPVEARASVVDMLAAGLPSMMVALWLMTAVVNGVLGQGAAIKTGRALRPTPVYGDIDLPDWVAMVLAVCALFGLMAEGDAGYIGRNAARALSWAYVLVGFAAVHQAARGRPNARVLLALFYVVFVALAGWAQVALAGLGLVRHWTRLRRRDAGGQEEL